MHFLQGNAPLRHIYKSLFMFWLRSASPMKLMISRNPSAKTSYDIFWTCFMYIFYLHCLSFELFWLFLNWPTFWVFLFWLPPMLLNRIHLHLHVQFYVKQQYGKMLCEETNLDLLYKWKNKSHTKGPNIYTSLKANLCQGRTWGFVFSIFFVAIVFLHEEMYH